MPEILSNSASSAPNKNPKNISGRTKIASEVSKDVIKKPQENKNEQTIAAAKEILRGYKFLKADVYRKGDALFEETIRFIKSHTSDDPRNATMDEKMVDAIVIFVMDKKNNEVAVALDKDNKILGVAD